MVRFCLGKGMPKEPKPALAYEPSSSSSGVTRPQFRLLLLLVFLQLVITVQSTYAPGIAEQLRQAWAEHKQKLAKKAARAAAVRQQLALEQQCSNFTRPVSTVMWEEEPKRAELLLAGPGYLAASVNSQQAFTDIIAIPQMAAACDPPVLSRLFTANPLATSWGGALTSNEKVLVFLHRMTTPSGRARLSCVFFVLSRQVDGVTTYAGGNQDGEVTGKLLLTRAFAGVTWVLSDGQQPPEPLFRSWVLDMNSKAAPLTRTFRYIPAPARERPGDFELQEFDKLRLFAGQPDPADGSHFTIAYELGGRPGTIDGFLRDDDTIHLVPREGKVVGGRWYPEAK